MKTIARQEIPTDASCLLLLTFPFVYDTGASGKKEVRVSYCKRPKKAVIRADEKTPSLRDFLKKLFAVLLPDLRVDSEVIFI